MISRDWKFWITTAITIVGVVVGVYMVRWAFFSDANAKSLIISVLSKNAIGDLGGNSFGEVKISIDGRNLDNAYVTNFQILHNGTRPIVASDFERPLEISMGEDVKIEKVNLKDGALSSLEPSYDLIDNKLRISPLLMNPGDLIAVEVLTAGGSPDLNVKGRIAGVSSIPIKLKEAEGLVRRLRFPILLSVFLFTFASFLLDPLDPRSKIGRARRSFAALLLTASSAVQLSLLADAFGMPKGQLSLVILILPLTIMAGVLSFWLDHRKRIKESINE